MKLKPFIFQAPRISRLTALAAIVISPVSGIWCTTSVAQAQEALTVRDSRGQNVVFPNGKRSFADRVVSFKKGSPFTTDSRAQNPQKVLGVPDLSEDENENYLALGTGGSLVVEFTDNYLVDINGPDLWIFEIGPLVEATDVAISKDGRTWIHVGRVEGSTAGIDIRSKVKAGDRFSFVRLTDVNNTHGDWPGADIDAIGAIGSVAREPVTAKPVAKPVVTKPVAKPVAKPVVKPAAKPAAAQPAQGCTNWLRIEMKDGKVVMVDLTKVARIVPVTK
jgi:hypothetical protein